ncbi:alpha/beta hydrolase [Streptomyces sp. TRM75561]|uniref:alpha/beta fold hydrolase n=1 Tax=Streptomyces sp. TRM75561 TaxID=2975269 RepID=UPI00244D5530|nr:alpha/beta hydrolase [Streptomyces sp. TRM75561]MDH3038920.1 alpha/beta hydrolase [Streptomyces sp. TRM75561]
MNNSRHLHSWKKRVIAVAGVAAGVAALVATSANASEEHHSEAKKPTVVLVHGAFADSSGWNGVIKKLQKDGYTVIAPANPLRGLHQDAEYLRSVLDSVSGPVVLAGHSYGGSVMSEAAAGDKDVKALVYLASFQPEVGESTSALAAKFPGGELGPALTEVPVQIPGAGEGTDLYIKQDKFREVFAADVPRSVTKLMAATQRPITSAALDETATKAAWKTIPSWSLITKQDLAVPLESQRFMSKRANSHITEINASHAVSVSEPSAVTKIIEEASKATVR